MFVPVKPFHPSLILVSKARPYTSRSGVSHYGKLQALLVNIRIVCLLLSWKNTLIYVIEEVESLNEALTPGPIVIKLFMAVIYKCLV
jgi:hypothetical protein